MSPTAGLILGAGLGIRFGGRKLLAPIGDKPMLQHVLDLAGAAGLAPVIVVLGTDADELRDACVWHGEWIAINPQPELGLAGSVRIGLAAAAASDAERVVVLMGDQPFLSADQLEAVLAATGDIVVPRFGGVQGNPVVLNRAIWPLAASLEGDRGFSQLFKSRPDLVTYVDIPGTNPDLDTRQELDSLSHS